jgi:hypothetical protein
MRRKNEADGEDRGRWSSKKKMNAVLRLLKGEDLDLLSRELKVNAAYAFILARCVLGQWSGGFEEP